jgi:4-hydroxy-2-oxoheptanedioate aldolase
VRKSKTLAKLRAGKMTRICSLGHFIPSYVRHAAHYGFDCIWLDCEHRMFENQDILALLAFFHLADIDCLLRPPTLEKTRLYRYLEDGATGLLIPHVSTPEKAHMLAQSVKFPPLGDRGLDGSGLDSDFYLDDAAGYTEEANRETFLVVQIETPEAVANVDAIAAVPGIDGLFIGPGDLGLRLRHSASGPTMDHAVDRVAKAAARHGKAWGCPAASTEQLQHFRALGAQLLAHGGDFMGLKAMLEAAARDFDAAGDS